MANATIFANTAVQECTAKILRMNNSPIPIPMQSLPKKFFLPTISPLFVSTSGYVNWSRKRNQVDVRRRRCFSCVVPYCVQEITGNMERSYKKKRVYKATKSSQGPSFFI